MNIRVSAPLSFDELAHLDDDLLQLPLELEGWLVEVGDGRAVVAAAGDPFAEPEHQRDLRRELGLPDQLALDVELERAAERREPVPGRALPVYRYSSAHSFGTWCGACVAPGAK
jgi:hypothetical protein